MKSKILLTLIVKDDGEYKDFKRMLESFMPHMAGLAVTFTGMSGKFKKSIKLVEKYGGEYVITTPKTHPRIYAQNESGYFFANFAEARNASFSLAAKMQPKHNFDWWSWADTDDVLVGGKELQEVAVKATELKMDLVFMTYWYAIELNKDGTFNENNVVIEHARERLIRPMMFKWISRLHEVAVPLDGNYKPINAPWYYSPKEGRNIVWAHLPARERVLGNLVRNAEILSLQVEEEKRKDPRTLFYLAKTYFDMRDKTKDQVAIELIKEYLQMSGWREERSSACEYVGDIHARYRNHKEAVEWYHKSTHEYPDRVMPWLKLARDYAELNLIEISNQYLDMALKMKKPEVRTTIGNPYEVALLAAQLCYNRAMREMKLDDAIYYLKIVQQLAKRDDDGMLKALEEAKLMNQAAIWFFNYAKWLKETGHEDMISNMLDSVPSELANEKFVQIIANNYQKPKTWAENEIAYYASAGAEHFEEWDENSLKKGIGGSETAVIRLAQEWVKLGYKVTVYAECQNHEEKIGDGTSEAEATEYDGVVTWKHWSQINWNDIFSTLILWRSPHLLDLDIRAHRLYMDVHDVLSQLDFSEARMNKLDKVFFKSKYHRGFLPKLPEEKVAIISNGI